MQKLKLMTWNLGFGAMGEDADISFDGGKKFVPSSKKEVQENIKGIQEVLQKTDADVYLLQELSSGSLLNRWQDLRSAVQDTLPEHSRSSVSNFSLSLFFGLLRNEHGIGTYMKDSLEVLGGYTKTFKFGERYYRVIPRLDHALTSFAKTRDGKPIAFINTHLSSFDKHGAMRVSQFLELITYIKKVYLKGYAVIVGADWNMHTGKLHFFENDEQHYKEYLHGFPDNLLPKGWTSHFPEEIPTVRASNRPYVKGRATTATIDGFICSPEIHVESVKTLGLEFKHADHNPVEISVSV